jgi:hypothetical protein
MLDLMANTRERTHCRERLERLSDSTLDCESIQREAIADLQRVIGFDRWCWPFADPDTLLPLSGVAEHDYGPSLPRALELEYSDDHFAAKPVLARRANSAGSLSGETGGDLARSSRWNEVLRPVGIGDVAAAGGGSRRIATEAIGGSKAGTSSSSPMLAPAWGPRFAAPSRQKRAARSSRARRE